MTSRFRRKVATLLVALLGFAQASVSLADCPMQRGMLAQTMAQAAAPPCEQGTHVKRDAPRYANRCVAHCTADLQYARLPAALVPGAAQAPVLLVGRTELAPARDTGLDVPPLGTPPPRILLHSFLI